MPADQAVNGTQICCGLAVVSLEPGLQSLCRQCFWLQLAVRTSPGLIWGHPSVSPDNRNLLELVLQRRQLVALGGSPLQMALCCAADLITLLSQGLEDTLDPTMFRLLLKKKHFSHTFPMHRGGDA